MECAATTGDNSGESRLAALLAVHVAVFFAVRLDARFADRNATRTAARVADRSDTRIAARVADRQDTSADDRPNVRVTVSADRFAAVHVSVHADSLPTACADTSAAAPAIRLAICANVRAACRFDVRGAVFVGVRPDARDDTRSDCLVDYCPAFCGTPQAVTRFYYRAVVLLAVYADLSAAVSAFFSTAVHADCPSAVSVDRVNTRILAHFSADFADTRLFAHFSADRVDTRILAHF